MEKELVEGRTESWATTETYKTALEDGIFGLVGKETTVWA